MNEDWFIGLGIALAIVLFISTFPLVVYMDSKKDMQTETVVMKFVGNKDVKKCIKDKKQLEICAVEYLEKY